MILSKIKDNVYSFETDSGKADLVSGKVVANLQWSGDGVYSMQQVEEEGIKLRYAVPKASTNLWFDGWCMLKSGIGKDKEKQQAAQAFVNYISRPDNVVRNMYYVGYTSVISGGGAGWALAYYQWYTARPFMKIYKVVTIEDLLKMYSVYHEMDIMKFVEAINEKWDQYYTETNLKRLRKIAGLSQRELADLSGVALRQIQLFEQKKRNINHTRAIDVLKIGKVLGCKSEDLLEI